MGNYNTGSKSNSGCAAFLLILFFGAIIYTGIRFFSDMRQYNAAMKYYYANDLETASANFNLVAKSFHIVDLGNYRKNAAAGLLSCASKQYKQAVLQYNSGNYRQSFKALQTIINKRYKYNLGNYFTLADKLQSNSLTSIQNRMDQYYQEGNCTVMLTDAAWAIANSKLIGDRMDIATIQRIQSICQEYQSMVINAGGSAWNKSKMMADFVHQHEGDALATIAAKKIKGLAVTNGIENVASPDACEILFRDWIGDGYEDYLFHCGKAFIDADESYNAIDMYEQFVEKYPNDARYQEVVDILADLLIASARSSGAGSLPAPEEAGKTKKGTSQYIVTNDTPYQLRLVFSGPESKIITIPACETCIEYSIAPFSCPSEGPEETIVLMPGAYSLLAETATPEGVTPYTGSFTLDDGTKYESCFYIVQRIY